MKVSLKRTKAIDRAVKIYGTVQRTPQSEAHRVVYIRSKNFRGWLCACDNFVFSEFAKGRNCDHLAEIRERFGRYGQLVK